MCTCRPSMQTEPGHARASSLPAPLYCPQALRARGVCWIIAPYEADAQMALLALRGEVHAVVTEDSDLLAYGCPRVRDTHAGTTHEAAQRAGAGGGAP